MEEVSLKTTKNAMERIEPPLAVDDTIPIGHLISIQPRLRRQGTKRLVASYSTQSCL